MEDGAGEREPRFWRLDYWLSGLVRMSPATHFCGLGLNTISSFRFRSSVLPTLHLQCYSTGIRTRSHTGRVSHKSLCSSQFSWTRLSNQWLKITETNKQKTEREAGMRDRVVRPAQSWSFPSCLKIPWGPRALVKRQSLGPHRHKDSESLEGSWGLCLWTNI